VLLAFSALLVGIPASASASAAAASTGYVSLGNLSQSPSPVDIYLYPSGSSSALLVEHGIAYGTIAPYQPVNVGDYSVKVRTAGSSASSNPVFSVSLTVKAGHAYMVAPLQTAPQAGQLTVIDNNLTTPQGLALVRAVQATLNQPQLTVHCSCAAGAPGNISANAAPGTVSPPAKIPPGSWTMTATGPTATASRVVPIAAGSIHTEVVINSPGGGIQLLDVTDAAGAGQMPTGGVSSGFGGTAPHGAGSPLPWLVLIGGGALLVLAGGWQVRRNGLRRLTPR
jgi:hypothetical protein